jgi:hypothetical protein
MRKALVEKRVFKNSAGQVDDILKSVIDEEIVAALAADQAFRDLHDRETRLRESIKEIKANLNPGARPAILVEREAQLESVSKEVAAYKELKRPEVTAQVKAAVQRKFQIKKEELAKRVEVLNADVAKITERLRQSNLAQISLEKLKQVMAQIVAMAARVNQELENLRVESETPSRITLLEEPAIMLGDEGNRRVKYSVLAGLAVLLLGVGLVIFLEARNRRLQTTDESSG